MCDNVNWVQFNRGTEICSVRLRHDKAGAILVMVREGILMARGGFNSKRRDFNGKRGDFNGKRGDFNGK